MWCSRVSCVVDGDWSTRPNRVDETPSAASAAHCSAVGLPAVVVDDTGVHEVDHAHDGMICVPVVKIIVGSTQFSVSVRRRRTSPRCESMVRRRPAWTSIPCSPNWWRSFGSREVGCQTPRHALLVVTWFGRLGSEPGIRHFDDVLRPGDADDRRVGWDGPMVTWERDAPPMVRMLGSSLRRAAARPDLAVRMRRLRGRVALRSTAGPQAVTIRFDRGRVHLTHGVSSGRRDLRGSRPIGATW